MRSKLLLITLSLVLVMSLVGGATFALFTDQESNTNDVFQAGTLTIGASAAGANTGTMNFTVAAPGDHFANTINVKNLGSLPFLYKVSASKQDGDADLYNALVATINGGPEMPLSALVDKVINFNLAAGGNQDVTIDVKLPLTAGNDLMNKATKILFTFDAQQVGTTTNGNNLGFETGDFSGWTVNQVSGANVIGSDAYATAQYGNSMAVLGTPGSNSQAPGMNTISQTFQATSPQLNFAYNIFTYDYPNYDKFQYTVSVLYNGAVIDSYQTTAWGSGTNLKTTGWVSQSLDLTGYEGKDLQLVVSAGGTADTILPTWAYFDVQ